MEWWSEVALLQVAQRAGASAGGGEGQTAPAPWSESARARGEDALACAQWLRAMGIKELRFIGPFGEHGLSIGDLVLVAAGARVYSTLPSIPKEGKVAARSKTVRVANLSPGLVIREGGLPVVRNPLVTWAGKGGYWCWCDVNSVQRVGGGFSARVTQPGSPGVRRDGTPAG